MVNKRRSSLAESHFRQQMGRFLEQRKPSRTLCISDFDGTFYRGLWPQRLRGISNVEFGFFLWLLHTGSWKKSGAIRRSLLYLRRESKNVYGHSDNKGKQLSDLEQPMIEAFSENVLCHCHSRVASKAGSWTARFCYSDAIKAMISIQSYVGSIFFISKAFPMVLNAVKNRLHKGGVEIPVLYRGIALKDHPWWQIDPTSSVLNWEDKKEALAHFAEENPRYKRAIIFGDTEDDVALFRQGAELWGEENVLLICLYPKDDCIRQEATVVLNNWGCVRKLLAESHEGDAVSQS